MKTTEIIRLSLYMLVKHIYFTIPMIILSAVAAASVFLLVPYLPIIPIIVPALAAMLYSYMMEILLKKYMPKEVVEQWYNE